MKSCKARGVLGGKANGADLGALLSTGLGGPDGTAPLPRFAGSAAPASAVAWRGRRAAGCACVIMGQACAAAAQSERVGGLKRYLSLVRLSTLRKHSQRYQHKSKRVRCFQAGMRLRECPWLPTRSSGEISALSSFVSDGSALMTLRQRKGYIRNGGSGASTLLRINVSITGASSRARVGQGALFH